MACRVEWKNKAESEYEKREKVWCLSAKNGEKKGLNKQEVQEATGRASDSKTNQW